jgi:hypothetical protein
LGGGRCRICASTPASERPVSISDGERRRWSVCDSCVGSLREVPWVDIDRAKETVRLCIEPHGLMDALGGAAEN